jgi:hypothetical protein
MLEEFTHSQTHILNHFRFAKQAKHNSEDLKKYGKYEIMQTVYMFVGS